MTKKDLPARAANIKRVVASTTQCTPAAVESLRSLLLPSEAKVQSQNSISAKTPSSRVKAISQDQRKPSAARARKQPAVSVREVPGEDDSQIQPQERFSLATEIANSTLKTLSAAIKNPPQPKQRQSLGRSTSNVSTKDGLESRSQTPLQPLSVNRIINSPRKHGHLRRSSSAASLQENCTGLRAQAECGRIAFASLRSLQGSKGMPPTQYLQIEAGMSALIARMITLGFDDLATKELRILRRRLETSKDPALKADAGKSMRTLNSDYTTDLGKEALPDMLRFSNIHSSGQLLALITTTQLQIIRVLTLRRDPGQIKAALQHLQLDVPYAPENLIEQQIYPNLPESRIKATHQLESLAQMLIALCPDSSSAKDDKVSGMNRQTTPHDAFQLHLLALQIRAKWWALAGHRVEIMKEIVDPFLRCLTTFKRRSRLDEKTKYGTATNAFQVLATGVKGIQRPSDKDLFFVHQILADMAQESGRYSEALQWTKRCRESASSIGISRTKQCTLNCRFASLTIRTSEDGLCKGLLPCLQIAAASLEGNLQGESSELDELLLAMASLRRSVFSVFQQVQKRSQAERPQEASDVATSCTDVALRCVIFLLRYIGRSPDEQGNPKTVARRSQRRDLANRVAYPVIECIAVMARLSSKAASEHWAKLESGLQTSLDVASILEEGNCKQEQAIQKEQQNASPFVSIANAYWLRGLLSIQGTDSRKASRDCLQKATGCLKNRPICDKVNGCLSSKFEKYGQHCEVDREYQKAVEAYAKALDTEIELGNISKATKIAETKSVPHAFECNAELDCLSRVLLAYPRAALKANDQGHCSPIFFDSVKLETSERGLLLEQQLISILSILQGQRPTKVLSGALNTIGQDLLKLYTRQDYPVRRLRVIVRLLNLVSVTSGLLENGFRDKLMQEPCSLPQDPHLDIGLMHFLPHVRSSKRLLASLCQGAPDLQIMEEVILLWSTMIHECQDFDMLRLQVYDMTDWQLQLDTMAEYLNMQGLNMTRVSVLNLMVAINDLAKPKDNSFVVSKLSALGLQYSRLGYSGMASVFLRRAQEHLEASTVQARVALAWHLASAENAQASGNFKACKEHLAKAIHLSRNETLDFQSQKTRSKDRSQIFLNIADLHQLHSALATVEGRSHMALLHARLSVRAYQKAWAIVERSHSSSAETTIDCRSEPEKETLSEALFELSMSESQSQDLASPRHWPLKGAAFWSIAPALIRGLTQLACLFAHSGLLPEVQHYLGQAQKIADAVKASPLQGWIFALTGQFLGRGGESDEGLKKLCLAEDLLSGMTHDRNYASLQVSLASCYDKQGRLQEGQSALDKAEKVLQRLTAKSFLENLTHKQQPKDDLTLRIESLSIREVKPTAQNKGKRRQPACKSTASKSVQPEAVADVAASEIPGADMVALTRVRDKIKRERALVASRSGMSDLAIQMLRASSIPSDDQQGVVHRTLLLSSIEVRQELEQLATDPVLGVLSESALACPSVRKSNNSQAEVNPSRSGLDTGNALSSKVRRAQTQRKKTKPRNSSLSTSRTEVIRQAQTGLTEISTLARKISSTKTLHDLTDLLGRVTLMLSAVPTSPAKCPLSPTFTAYTLEAGRVLAMSRESEAIKVEQQLCLSKSQFDWPDQCAVEKNDEILLDSNFTFLNFQSEYIDIISDSWTAISMTLSESREEIILCKMIARQTPFVLRLPLSRHSSIEPDEDTFGFDVGKAELTDIIQQANQSTHGAQDLSQKGAKTKWWEARAALDARLKDLLHNVETIWFGGFRGIFDPQATNPALFARFQQSLQNILNKYLPSRQKSGGSAQSSQMTLDQHVIELFTGLGNPSETNDIDEPLMDLLYFVVDILQFNGERNAYDEIDFDSAIIETIDALRQYHQAASERSETERQQHTILILDKHLHGFPWESLPCMRGQSISRLPSLGCLRERIIQNFQPAKPRPNLSTANDRIYVCRNKGTSILNPGGDLTNTQSKFEVPLRNLPGWETIVRTEPGESKLKSALESKDIFLYFGHGSGSQYIRSRTIKKLETCAVALLMGCSSGALTEAGEFEPYGTPLNYMHAGCPAVLATLWDVTDKDIDKFSQTLLEKWGLFGGAQPTLSSSPVKKSAKQRGKSKVRDAEIGQTTERSEISLSEAVPQARESCILKYLNGAAPVVYGIPVYLHD